MVSLKNVEEAVVLLCVGGLGFKKPYKTYQKVGFSLPNVAKTRFLLCFFDFWDKKVKKAFVFPEKKIRLCKTIVKF